MENSSEKETIDTRVEYMVLDCLPKYEVKAPFADLCVCEATANDFKYYLKIYRKIGKNLKWRSRYDLTESEFDKLYSSATVKIYFLKYRTEVVGLAEFELDKPNIAQLRYFGVLSLYIGKGLGKYFLDKSIKEVWCNDIKKIVLTTRDLDHKNARYCYLKYGFVIEDTYINKIKCVKEEYVENIIFDIGNIFVTWSPEKIIASCTKENIDIDSTINKIFFGSVWKDLNLGEITEKEAIIALHRTYNFSIEYLEEVFYCAKSTQLLVKGSCSMLKSLCKQGYKVYALSNNTIEIVRYLKNQYNFWNYFDGIVISSDVGHKKPDPEIFDYMLKKYKLNPLKTIFIDDHSPNVEAAKLCSINTIHFESVDQCKTALYKDYNVSV